jgi:hypothetical protein
LQNYLSVDVSYRRAVHALNPDPTLDPTCVLPIETAATPPALLARSRARRRAALSPRDSSRPSPSLPCAPSARSCSRRRPLASSHLPRSIRSSCGENSESGEQIYGGAELHGVLLRGLLGARLRGHRAHAPPPGLRPRPQARHIHLRPRRQPLPVRLRRPALPQVRCSPRGELIPGRLWV